MKLFTIMVGICEAMYVVIDKVLIRSFFLGVEEYVNETYPSIGLSSLHVK